MQKKTVVRLMVELKANYRYTFRDVTKEEMAIMTERWYDCLKHFTDEQVENAFKVALCKLSMPPTIADIIGIISRQERLTEPSDADLWRKIVTARGELCQSVWVKNGGFRALWELRGKEARRVYEMLPIAVQHYVGFEAFCDLCGMDDEELKYERARFLKSISDIREAVRESTIFERRERLESGLGALLNAGGEV